MGEERVDLSIVVPLYNEEDNVRPLYEAVREVVRTLPQTAELVLVDDGSTDATFARARALPCDPMLPVRIVRFRRNYGQTAAMATGIRLARGRVIVTMDGDLQNDPQDIPRFLATLEEGYDLVVGWRRERKDHWTRVLPSRIANRLIGWVTGVPIRDNGCSLKAYRAELIRRIPLYAEMHRFIPAMASLAAPRIAELEVRHHPRRFGRSKYGFSRVYKVLLDLLAIRTILSFARRPVAWLVGLALFAFAAGLPFAVLALDALTSEGRPSVVWSALTLLAGSFGLFALALGFLVQTVHRGHAHELDLYRRLSCRRLDPLEIRP